MTVDLLFKSSPTIDSEANTTHIDADTQLKLRTDELEEFPDHLLQVLQKSRGKALTDEERTSSIQARLIHANLVRRNRFDIYLKACLNESRASRSSISTIYPPDHDKPRPESGTKTSEDKVLQPCHLEKGYPKSPSVKSGPLLCPYCAQFLDSVPPNSDKWRSHLEEDLSPYSCVYPQCTQPDAMYVTIDEWKKHLRDHHSNIRWLCDTCWLGSDDPGAFEFDREENYRKHLDESHQGEFDPEELSLLIELSQRKVVPTVNCPLCPDHEPLLYPETDKHLSEHLHSFAFNALLWRVDMTSVVKQSTGPAPSPHDDPIAREIEEEWKKSAQLKKRMKYEMPPRQ